MKELVDKEEIKKAWDIETAKVQGQPYVVMEGFFKQVLKTIKPLSPAEIGGDSWVLEEFKKKLELFKDCKIRVSLALQTIKDLEAQAPAELAKQVKENERKAEAWDSLYGLKSKKSITVKTLKEIMETILALVQEENPAKAEEESHEER